MSRSFTIDELNKRIDTLIAEYEKERVLKIKMGHQDEIIAAKIEALNDLKLELNDPQATIDVTENIQQTINVIQAEKIIKDGM